MSLNNYDEAGYRKEDLYYFDVEWPNLAEVWKNCMESIMIKTFTYMSQFFLWNVTFRLASQTVEVEPHIQHLASIVCGLALAYFSLGWEIIYSIGFTSITQLMLFIITQLGLQNYGITLAFFCLASLTIGEMVDTDVVLWHHMRGTQMIAVMKVISIGFDIDLGRIGRPPRFLHFWGYILCPANVVMGPWVSYGEYVLILERPSWTTKWAFHAHHNAVIATFFLVASNCLIDDFIPDFGIKWIAAYKAALSYRCSHYFMCYLSQCTMLLAGFGSGTDMNPTRKDKLTLGYSITRPWNIEFPRSLATVVISWNLSMHLWLKSYIFNPLKREVDAFLAIIATYVITSSLHGANIQLTAGLLTIALIAYCEYPLRKKISHIYDACVLAHPCPDNCKHRYRSTNFCVIAFNFAFGMLTVFHLAYLGLMLEGPAEQPRVGHSSLNRINDRWRTLSYFSHWIIFATLGASTLL